MEDKIYFNPGDIVKFSKDIDNSPKSMLVINRVKLDNDKYISGINCLMFDDSGSPYYIVVNTKDLEHFK